MARQPLFVRETWSFVRSPNRAMLRRLCCVVVFPLLWLSVRAADADAIMQQALAAEARGNAVEALALFRQADAARPNDPVILQKIAKQLSDASEEVPNTAAKKTLLTEALTRAQRAVQLAPDNAVNVLSLAICHGKLGLCSDTRQKVEYSRRMKEETERALALDPNYALAYYILGRWNAEVAALSGPTRFVARLVYGGLPDASHEKAVACFQRAIALAPDVPTYRLELGFEYLASGKKAEARKAFEIGLAQPSHDRYDDAAKGRAHAALATLR